MTSQSKPAIMENARLCRICMSESTIMLSLFGEDSLWQKITAFATVQIEKDDFLPQQICMICARDVIKAASLKRKCEDADRYFRRVIELEMLDVISISLDDDVASIKSEPPGATPPAKRSTVEATSSSGIENSAASDISIQSPKVLSRNSIEIGSNFTPIEEPEPSDSRQTADETPAASSQVENLPRISALLRTQPIGHPCPICEENFAIKQILKHHMKQNHPEVPSTVECVRCGRKYSKKVSLEKHLRACKPPTQMKKILPQSALTIRCPKCYRTFPTRRHLGYHKRPGRCQVVTVVEKKSSAPASTSQQVGVRSDLVPSQSSDSNPKQQLHLNESQLTLAKSLVRQNADIKTIAEQLNISETIALRLHYSIINSYQQQRQPQKRRPGRPRSVPNAKTVFKGNADKNRIPNGLTSSASPGVRIKVESTQKSPVRKSQTPKKPRKRYVFMTDSMYERAKMIVGNRGTTGDVAKQLNISPMTAWRVRQCILNNIPLKFSRNPRTRSGPIISPVKGSGAPTAIQRTNSNSVKNRPSSRFERTQLLTKEIENIVMADGSLTLLEMSERLASKGFSLTPGAICQKLKLMGYSRNGARRQLMTTSRKESPTDE